MPNHETNNVVIIGMPANIRRFVNEALSEGGPDGPEKILDFDRILPMPPELRDTVSPHDTVTTQVEADLKNAEYNEKDFTKMFRDEDAPPQIKYLTFEEEQRRLREYGALDWYTWALANWGTKWGAYSHSHYELRFLVGENDEVYGRVDLRFETAWSAPIPIFEKIEELFEVQVHAVTQDEGGFPDVVFGDPVGEELLSKNVSYEFESWHAVAEEPIAEEAE